MIKNNLMFCFLILLFAISVSAIAQLPRESVLEIISTVKGDTAKVDSLINTCRQKWKYAHYTEAKKFADAALMLAEKAAYKDGIAEANNQIGIVYWYVKDYDNALSYHLKALEIYTKSGNKQGISGALNRIGHAYADMPDYTKALEYFQKALNLDELLNDQMGISKNLNLLGFVYMKLSDYPKALDYYFKSMALSKKINSKRGIAAVNHDIGEVLEKQNKPNEALLHATKGLALALQVGENKLIQEAYEGLEKIYLRKHDFKNAYNTRIKCDEILSVQTMSDHAGKIKQMQMEYEFDKRQMNDKMQMDREKEVGELKLKRQQELTYISFAAVIITILFSIFLYRSYSRQRIANQKLKQAQKQLVISEKMAAFGVMASRVSHEIANPLNFINNFSEASTDLANELLASGMKKHNEEIVMLIKENLLKISKHGNRAATIISRLQDHSNKGTAHEFFEEK